MPCSCSDEAIFVLNKWDTILEEDHRREFLDITKENLPNLWKEIDDNNIIKLAAANNFFLFWFILLLLLLLLFFCYCCCSFFFFFFLGGGGGGVSTLDKTT